MRKSSIYFLLASSFCLLGAKAFGQNDAAKDLVKQGIELNDAGKYAEAIEKYGAALKADPNNLQADYEMGFTLYNTGKGKEAIPFLEKILQSNDPKYETYDLLGSIYDDNNETDKAIECYKNGIKDNPGYERLHFNLGICYLRQKKYADAEACETEAIKLNPKHASAQRMYALAELYQDKRICSLLAWCSFLLLEPNSQRSAEAYTDIRRILNYGINGSDGKKVNINVSLNDLKNATNLSMQLSVIASTENKKGLTAVDTLALQLTSIFESAPEYGESKDPFFGNFFANFFNKLAISGNMPAFTRFISLTAYKGENAAWFKDNAKQLNDLDLWIRSTDRSF